MRVTDEFQNAHCSLQGCMHVYGPLDVQCTYQWVYFVVSGEVPLYILLLVYAVAVIHTSSLILQFPAVPTMKPAPRPTTESREEEEKESRNTSNSTHMVTTEDTHTLQDIEATDKAVENDIWCIQDCFYTMQYFPFQFYLYSYTVHIIYMIFLHLL